MRTGRERRRRPTQALSAYANYEGRHRLANVLGDSEQMTSAIRRRSSSIRRERTGLSGEQEQVPREVPLDVSRGSAEELGRSGKRRGASRSDVEEMQPRESRQAAEDLARKDDEHNASGSSTEEVDINPQTTVKVQEENSASHPILQAPKSRLTDGAT